MPRPVRSPVRGPFVVLLLVCLLVALVDARSPADRVGAVVALVLLSGVALASLGLPRPGPAADRTR